jgi:hypothetical protein
MSVSEQMRDVSTGSAAKDVCGKPMSRQQSNARLMAIRLRFRFSFAKNSFNCCSFFLQYLRRAFGHALVLMLPISGYERFSRLLLMSDRVSRIAARISAPIATSAAVDAYASGSSSGTGIVATGSAAFSVRMPRSINRWELMPYGVQVTSVQ